MIGVDQAAGRCQEAQRTVGQLVAQAADVAPQNRIQIRVHDRRIAARHDLDQRGDPAGDADFLESDRSGQLGDERFVIGTHEAVQQTNSQRLDALLGERGQLPTHLNGIGGQQHAAFGVDAFVDFGHRGKQRLGLLDGQVEQSRTILIADVQDVAKPTRRDQRRAGAAARDQCVSAARRAQPHAHPGDWLRERQAQQIADRHDRRFGRRGKLVALANRRIVRHGRGQLQRRGPRVESRDGRFELCGSTQIEQAEPVTVPEAFGIGGSSRVDDLAGRRPRRDGALDDPGAEHFVMRQAAIGSPRKTVGEGPAHVNPEFPSGHADL